MYRKPWFWVALVVLMALCAWYTAANFPRAFPLVTLDLEMDREAALDQARQLAERHGWGPDGYRQAAVFDLDFELQSFVELEGGGKDAFSAMLSEGLVSPYSWRVRNFREFETTETLVLFTPAGEPYGFRVKLPEDQAGAALTSDEARPIAEAGATSDWAVDLGRFELVEASQEVRPSGRVDHTFVYERPQLKVGEEGRYRLRLVVSGDAFTELTQFVKIPESFERRYEEMRSANNGISIGAVVAAAVIYLIGGAVIGSFLLLRERWVLWKQPVKWAIFVVAMWTAVSLNQWPLAWMGYDTAVSSANFTLQQVVLAVVQSLLQGVLFAVSVIAAESLTRKAFPHHIQLWKAWSPEVASTRSVAGLTVAGFLLVAGFLAYEVFLYAFANDRLGWWAPSSPLIDPNALATYFPWLTSVGVSLWAGFWEESFFRAIPLSCAALIGRRFGGQRYWIIGTLLVQAIIFGAGHANYPQQPAYARVVEMIVPFVGFGLIYLAFGLLPVIVLHFAVDVVFFSMPLFAASSPGIWVDRTMVIVLTLVPLWVVFRGRLKTGRWGDAGEEVRNAAWQPPPAPVVEAAAAPTQAATGLGSRLRTALLVAGAAGLVVWLVTADFSSDAPPIRVGRTDVLVAAQEQLQERGINLGPEWMALSQVVGDVGLADRFVWQEGGEEAYDALLGTYLREPAWYVRRVRFEGDVVERAEEYGLWFDGEGAPIRFMHRIPEARPGAQLDEDAARVLAHGELRSAFGLDPAALDEISAEPEQQPERRDWKFVFSDPASYSLEQGDARAAVEIAGDQVVDSYRFIHVPEEWERAERNRATLAQVIQIVCTVVMGLVFVAGAIAGIVRWSRGRFAPGTFVQCAALLLVVSVVGIANSWPVVTSQFSTAQPYKLQAAVVVAGAVIALLGVAIGVALNVGFVHRWIPAQPGGGRAGSLSAGAALGALVAGVIALGSSLAPSVEPTWGAYATAGTIVPLIAAALEPISSWITSATLVMLMLGLVHAVSRGWTRARVPLAALLVVAGLILAGSAGVETVPAWLAAGVAVGVLLLAAYLLVLRFHLALVPVAAAAVAILGALHEGVLGTYPGALAGSVVAALLVAVLAAYWFGRLTRDTALG